MPQSIFQYPGSSKLPSQTTNWRSLSNKNGHLTISKGSLNLKRVTLKNNLMLSDYPIWSSNIVSWSDYWIIHWIPQQRPPSGQLHPCQRHGCGGREGFGFGAAPRTAAAAGARSLRGVCATEELGGGDGHGRSWEHGMMGSKRDYYLQKWLKMF